MKNREGVIFIASLYFSKLEVEKCKLKIESLEVIVGFEQREIREDPREAGLEVLIWVLKNEESWNGEADVKSSRVNIEFIMISVNNI